MKIDLHLHTNYSDGRLSPHELLQLCQENNYTTIAITDHDNIDGYLSVKDEADRYDLNLIPGLEISSEQNGVEVHILAYYFDDENQALLDLLGYINENRINRAKKILSNLAQIGLKLDIDELMESTGKSGIIGRMHIARAMVEKNYCSYIQEVFDKYLNDRSPIFEPKLTLEAKEIISMINATGGISVLAHPHKIANISTVMDTIENGIEGLEVYCAKSASYNVTMFEELAAENKLLKTGGSDFHGEPQEMNYFGSFSVPEFCLKEINEYRKRKYNEKLQ
jgi:3',5'-nucleoside bisphosphate phosphatase